MNVLRLFWKVCILISVSYFISVKSLITQSGTALFILAILNITRIHSVFTYMFIAQDRHKSSNPHDTMAYKQRSPLYHNTETNSHTLKGVVRRFGFSRSWLPGMHEWRAW